MTPLHRLTLLSALLLFAAVTTGCGSSPSSSPADTAADAGDDANGSDDAGADDANNDDATAGDASTDDADANDTPDAPDDLTPTIAEAFADCTRPGEAGGLAGGVDLARVDIDTDAFPDATCSDGTPGLFFVRAGSDSSRWVIQLQGGGACNDPQACADRWCSHETNFGANKLSNQFAPERGTRARGILADRDDNAFQDWNKVFIYYCTSDLWAGTAGMTEVEAAHPLDGGDPTAFRVSHGGTHVIDATLAMLRQGDLTVTDPQTMEEVAIPDLDDAEEVAFTGASAGGNGVAFHADRLGTTLKADNPDLRYWALIDSAFGVSTTTLGFEDSLLCSQEDICSWQELWTGVYEDTRRDYHQALLDDTCVDWHQANAPDSTILCADNGHVIENHLQTPFVLRMGLRDSLIGAGMVSRMFTVPAEADATLDEERFAALTSARVSALTDVATTAEEADSIDDTPGLFAPPCPKHETLGSNDDTFDAAVEVDGNPVRFMDVIGRFRNGQAPAAAVFTPGEGQNFSCP